MTPARWWWTAALVADVVTVVSLLLTGSSGLSVGLALFAAAVGIIALVVYPTPMRDRRPW